MPLGKGLGYSFPLSGTGKWHKQLINHQAHRAFSSRVNIQMWKKYKLIVLLVT